MVYVDFGRRGEKLGVIGVNNGKSCCVDARCGVWWGTCQNARVYRTEGDGRPPPTQGGTKRRRKEGGPRRGGEGGGYEVKSPTVGMSHLSESSRRHIMTRRHRRRRVGPDDASLCGGGLFGHPARGSCGGINADCRLKKLELEHHFGRHINNGRQKQAPGDK